MLYFSKQTQGYYDTSFAKYILPDDVVEVTKEEYKKLLELTHNGRTIVEEKGSFVGVERILSDSEYKARELVWLEIELRRAGQELDKVQDSDPSSVGTVTEWRGYRKALRIWPDHPEFPKTEFRPKSPDFKE